MFENKYIDKISTLENKESPKTLLELITILRIYDKYRDDESIRILTADYFCSYHRDKYLHYVDKKGHTDFILNCFFDDSKNVFKKLSGNKPLNSSYCRFKIYKGIVNDQRLKEYFENNSSELKEKLDHFENGYGWSIKFRGEYDFARLHSVIYDGITDEILRYPISGKYNDGSFNKKYYKNNNNNYNIINSYNNRNKNYKTFILSDIIIEKIIRYSLLYIDDRMDKVIINDNLLSYGLVCKQFFKVLSRILNNEYFEWKKSIIQFNNDSEFSLIKQPPLYFDYQSIRLIPYSSSIEYVKLLFSRVESFYIKTDEHDSWHQDMKRGYKIIPDKVPDYTSSNYMEESKYRYNITSPGYLVYPPPMPSLESITIDQYYGYQSNYAHLIKHISIKYFNDFKTSKLNINDRFGIKRFSINIQEYHKYLNDKSNIKFIKQVLEYHSNSLEKVEIDCSNTKGTYPNAKYICPNQLESLKSLINNQSNNKINWSLSVKNINNNNQNIQNIQYLGFSESDNESDNESDSYLSAFKNLEELK
ncbi:hypothetical protein ACTFIR_005337 [Dictyostelium discoideum]